MTDDGTCRTGKRGDDQHTGLVDPMMTDDGMVAVDPTMTDDHHFGQPSTVSGSKPQLTALLYDGYDK